MKQPYLSLSRVLLVRKREREGEEGKRLAAHVHIAHQNPTQKRQRQRAIISLFALRA